MRKVYVNLNVRLTINADNNIDIQTILSEMDYNFEDTTTKANIIDTEITDWSIEDSK